MTRATGSRHNLGIAALLILAGVLAALGVIALAGGSAATGTLSLISAAFAVTSGLLVRLNWRLIENNRALLQENTRLLLEQAEQQRDSRPHP